MRACLFYSIIILILIAAICFLIDHESRYGLCGFFIKYIPLIFADCTLVRLKTLTCTSKPIAVFCICGWKLLLTEFKSYFLILFLWFYHHYCYSLGQELLMKNASVQRGTDEREKEIDDRRITEFDKPKNERSGMPNCASMIRINHPRDYCNCKH